MVGLIVSPRVWIENGNLVFQVPNNKDITFRTLYGKVRFNNVDLSQLTGALQSTGSASKDENEEPWPTIKRSLTKIKKMEEDLATLRSSVNAMLNHGQIRPVAVFQTVSGFNKLKARVRKLNQVRLH